MSQPLFSSHLGLHNQPPSTPNLFLAGSLYQAQTQGMGVFKASGPIYAQGMRS